MERKIELKWVLVEDAEPVSLVMSPKREIAQDYKDFEGTVLMWGEFILGDISVNSYGEFMIRAYEKQPFPDGDTKKCITMDYALLKTLDQAEKAVLEGAKLVIANAGLSPEDIVVLNTPEDI